MKKFLLCLLLQGAAWGLPGQGEIGGLFLRNHPEYSQDQVRVVEVGELGAAALGTFESDRGYVLTSIFVDGKFLEPRDGAQVLLKGWERLSPQGQEQRALQIVKGLLWAFEQPKQSGVVRLRDGVEVSANLGYAGMVGPVRWKDRWTISGSGQVGHLSGD